MGDVAVLTSRGVVPLSYDAVTWVIERVPAGMLDTTLEEFDSGLTGHAVCVPGEERVTFTNWLRDLLDGLDPGERSRVTAELSYLLDVLSVELEREP
jgi:hypothetical protein